MLSILFASAILLAAALLFLVQLMVAKMLLPVFGGAPAVWNTCMVFFQAGLLAGYGYAHAAGLKLGVRRHALVHLVVLLLPALSLPIILPVSAAMPETWPIPRLLGLLAAMVGLPFFVTSTTSPLLQRWFASTGHPRAHDPYFLYAASNAGSFLGLIGYVFVVEPNLTLTAQSRLWSAGYVLLALATAACALIAMKSRADEAPESAEEHPPAANEPQSGDRGWRRVLRWVALAMAPSSLMLAVTTFLSAEIAPMPLLWVAPLALYLLSYIVAFAGLPPWFDRMLAWAMPMALLAEVPILVDPFGEAPFTRLVLSLVFLFVIATACHRELARRRPAPNLLTAYYLWIAVGGVLGGVLNALVAPLIFTRFLELPLSLVLAGALLRPPFTRGLASLLGPRGWIFAFVPVLALTLLLGRWTGASLTTRVAIASTLGLLVADRPARFATALALLLIAGLDFVDHQGPIMYRSRNFFGMLTIREDGAKRTRRLLHGATLHGLQLRGPTPADWQTPTLYYYPTGPIGQVFSAYYDTPTTKHVGVVGLGVGSLTTYAKPGDDYTLFEINPEVVRIASDPEYFTHLRDCKTQPRIVIGDARQALAREPPGRFGMLIVDAFSGDAIPVHLLTREAFELMRDRLMPDGLLALHVSNRYLDLAPVVGATARTAGLVGLQKLEDVSEILPQERARGKEGSHWILLTRRGNDLSRVSVFRDWKPLVSPPGVPVWTDDYSDLLSARRPLDP